MDTTSAPAHAEEWGLARRIGFRFAFCYFALYFCAYALGLSPWTAPAVAYQRLWHRFVPWVGEHVLHLAEKITVFPAGSGDTTYNYVELLCYVVFALAATVLWSLLDRRSRHHERLHTGLRFGLRFVVGVTLIGYGMAKIIPTQFPFPSYRMEQRYGDSSPMGLLWTFMGFSFGYNLFAGLGETVGGALLFYRRTTTLGGLLLVGVMANVVALEAASGATLTLQPSVATTSFVAPTPLEPGTPGFELVWNDAESLDVAGELEGELIVAQLKKRVFLLESRGFHWINEQPFNR